MDKTQDCCDWHKGKTGHGCDICKNDERCAWIFQYHSGEIAIRCLEHQPKRLDDLD